MNEDKIEKSMMDILGELGWETLHGPDIEPDRANEREYTDAVLGRRLKEAVARINANIAANSREEAIKKIIRSKEPTLLLDNRDFHELLVNGVDVEVRDKDGEIRTDKVWLFDFENPDNNEFVAVNQLTVKQGDHHRRPDIVLFVNGLPLVVIELKNVADAKADTKKAYRQIQTYKDEIPALFRFNELCIISDGIDTGVGTINSNLERFMPWKTIDGEKEAGNVPMLEVALRGMCAKDRLLDICRNYIVFERSDSSFVKKVAAYHQYWAVQKAVASTTKATKPEADHRAGVVWHTQGSGKSLSMVFYAGKLAMAAELKNPTIVIVTDRNDLDGQLFDTFAACQDILRQEPVQAHTRKELRKLLNRESGGVIFTTIQKFAPGEDNDKMPVLSDRNNIIVIADEAHRSQYGLKARIRQSDAQLVYGYAKYMRDGLPSASYIGFTGTPLERDDRSTPAVFGDYVDIYDIQQAVEDKATVPIYYESRLIDLGMDESTKHWLDTEIEGLLEGEEVSRQDQLKAEWTQKEAIVGNNERLQLVAEDIVRHFEERLSAIDGKAMIVNMSRRIAADLYEKIVALRPEWHNDSDNKGFIKAVMTGSASDDQALQPHIRSKDRLRLLAARMKNPESDMKLVIVCDMWLTGFDVPNMHTMYLDKPLQGHNLMQAIARVNRVYPGKDGGLVVDYLGVASALREALADYTAGGGTGTPTIDQTEAVAIMKQKYEVVRDLFHGFDYKRYFKAKTNEQLQIILDAQEHIAGLEDGPKRLKRHVVELGKAFGLAMPHDDAITVREEVAFFQAVNARLEKVGDPRGGPSDEDYHLAIRQIVDKAIAPIGVVDIFAAAGLEKPELSILSDEFLAEMRSMERKNLAAMTLKKLLEDKIKVRFKRNKVKMDSFFEMLEETLMRYKSGTIEAAQVVEELIEIAKKVRTEIESEESSGLGETEIAFYDALIAHGNAHEIMGDEKLRNLAKLLVERVRKNVSVDWSLRESAQARLRVEVKKLLREFGYPPDNQAIATKLVLEQASLFGDELA
ncbi:MAG TPA: type I restriction endonuclease subunit R [Candidatus Dormibacteraeota bacterium]|nr:type I restriction endonuclease subunit R [Candidatus Dormibacteraeota bacterium]